MRVLMQGGARTDLLEDHGYTALALAQLHRQHLAPSRQQAAHPTLTPALTRIRQHLVVKILKQPPPRERGRKFKLLGRRQASSSNCSSCSSSSSCNTTSLADPLHAIVAAAPIAIDPIARDVDPSTPIAAQRNPLQVELPAFNQMSPCQGSDLHPDPTLTFTRTRTWPVPRLWL